MKKTILLLLILVGACLSNAQTGNVFVDPTGTYVLKGEKYRGEIKGSYGEVRIKLLSDSLVAITLYTCNGYPDYASASFTDTMQYETNRAVHFSRSDPSCQLVFLFDNEGLNMKQVYTDPASTCGFPKGTIPLGFIAKYSSEIPIIQPISRSR